MAVTKDVFETSKVINMPDISFIPSKLYGKFGFKPIEQPENMMELKK